MKYIKLFLILGIFSTYSCDKQSNKIEMQCLNPHCIIYLQPYDDYSCKEVVKLLPILQSKFDEFLNGGWEFKVLKAKKLPTEAYVAERDRYQAYSLLNDLETCLPKKHDVIIGLTHKDICHDIHNQKNYGIMGLSFRKGNVGVVSDKRVKPKTQVWKIILHEFIHAYYGAKHCPNDDPTCFMKDAKGKGNVKAQNGLCKSCKN